MNSLLLEIGVEEIPASYIQPAIEAFSMNLSKELLNYNIEHGFVQRFATPRRLALLVKGVASKQKRITKRVYGPPGKLAFDDNGDYAVPAIKFAEKMGVSLNELEIASSPKGNYVSIQKTEESKETKILLKTILPELILSIPFPKSMRWSNLSINFARPIRTIVAILGSDVIKFVLGDNIESGKESTGHFFMSPGALVLSNPDDYLNVMKKVSIIADIEERRGITCEAITNAASSIGGKILPDDELIDIVNNLVEFPVAMAGKFDDIFLDMPRDILITVMREHQKYFALIDNDDELLPGFVVVNNTFPNNIELVTVGHERVLQARLADAKFFYDNDIKASMHSWVEKLKGVLFYAKLGTMHDKVIRIRELSRYLASTIEPKLTQEILRAAYLCKADLVSQIVTEFPKLQGCMGSIYARLAGESREVFLAIEEHYKPNRSGGLLPMTKAGALISIADKIDSICGCFFVGLIPTGTSDPYALRRQAIGLLRTIRAMKFNIPFEELVEKGVKQYAYENKNEVLEISEKICHFLENRFFQLLVDAGYSVDVISAVINGKSKNIFGIESRIIELEGFKKTNEFISIALVFKRIKNILSKTESVTANVSEELFENNSEAILYKVYCDTDNKLKLLLNDDNIYASLQLIASLNKPVDLFFNQVMVMSKNKKVRHNRLALLKLVSDLFLKIADFSKIIT